MPVMSSSLQNIIYSVINQPLGLGFLNIACKPNFDGGVALSLVDLQAAYSSASMFFLSDFVLYMGVIVVIIVLGLFYQKTAAALLATRLARVSAAFIYLSLFLNLAGIYSGFDLLSSHSIYIFESSYSFTMFSQLVKVLVLGVMSAMYALFPYVKDSNMRLLELPLLMQITLALCSTVLSSNNLALLLLSLEGFSLILYIMTALGRTYGGITASVKYFAFGTLGSIFLF